MRRRRLVATVLVLLPVVGSPCHAADRLATGAALSNETQQVPVKEHVVHLDGRQQTKPKKRISINVTYDIPDTLKEAWDTADVVAMARVTGGKTQLTERSDPDGRLEKRRSIATVLDVNVLEIFRDNAGALVQRGRNRIRQDYAGVAESEDHVHEGADAPLEPGTNWLLFLIRWNGELKIAWGRSGALEVVGNTVCSSAPFGLAGMSVDEVWHVFLSLR